MQGSQSNHPSFHIKKQVNIEAKYGLDLAYFSSLIQNEGFASIEGDCQQEYQITKQENALGSFSLKLQILQKRVPHYKNLYQDCMSKFTAEDSSFFVIPLAVNHQKFEAVRLVWIKKGLNRLIGSQIINLRFRLSPKAVKVVQREQIKINSKQQIGNSLTSQSISTESSKRLQKNQELIGYQERTMSENDFKKLFKMANISQQKFKCMTQLLDEMEDEDIDY